MTKKIALTPENNPGRARWCEEHHRLECTKNRNRGRGPCQAPAIRGTNACRIHGGIRTSVAKVQGEARIITAWDPGDGGQSTQLDAGMAVLSVLQMTYLRLGMYSELLRQQVAAEGLKADDPIKEDANASGLIGFRYGMGGKDGIVYIQSEEARALVMLEASERDRVVKYAKTAHDMGISSRMTALAERWGDIVAARVVLVLDALDLDARQQTMVPALLQSHLGSIEIDGMESEKP